MTTILLILVCVSAYGVMRIGSEVLANRAHLSEESIKEYKYRRRSLSEPSQRRITNHIGTCEECRALFMEVMNE